MRKSPDWVTARAAGADVDFNSPRRLAGCRLLLAVICLAGLVAGAQAAPQIIQLNSAHLWQRLEFSITNVPSATNPFDPDCIRLDAAFTLPSGKTMNVPGFWFQDYQRGMSGGYEVLSQRGLPEWRLRFTPPESDSYSMALTIRTNGQLYGSAVVTNFTVATAVAPPGSGYVRIAGSQQYFETGDGQALRLIGENVCWHGGRGTYDYDDWFPAMQSAGENYARLWMCPWAFGIETDANSLTHYRLDQAWRLDYVFQLAEQRGIYLLLCLDYHGMFEVTPDYWGGNNFWGSNPYCVTNGGPCLDQNGFFTNATARTVYQKRLRYLTARYGCSPKLLAWQFFNEIDNVYAYLVPNDVAAWHGVMGGWLHTNDPFCHLVTTSLTGSSDRPELWTVPQLDFAAYHSYSEPGPAARLNAVAQSFLPRYGKPVLIDEFGTDWRGWGRTNDPHLRGFRQGLWGGALGGSAGTSMPWYWENIHSENVYPFYSALGTILNRTGWGRGAWTNINFQTAGSPPVMVGDLIPGGQPFNAVLPLSGVWAGMPSGELALPNSTAAGYSAAALNSFFHGIWHSDLKVPFRLNAWLTNGARIVLHLNSVSEGSILVVLADGAEMFRTNLPNLDGTYNVNNEYNLDIPVGLPAGRRLITVTNAGNDWFYLDWVRLEGVLPSTYIGGWKPSPDAIGLRGPRESLLYVVAPGASFPGGATDAVLPLQHGNTVTLANWPAGRFYAEWYDPATGTNAGYSQACATNGSLVLPLPDFREDLAGIVYPPPVLTAAGIDGAGSFRFNFDSETGGRYLIEQSADLAVWTAFLTITNSQGTLLLADESAKMNARAFFRAKSTR
jgi:hypothetical protein